MSKAIERGQTTGVDEATLHFVNGDGEPLSLNITEITPLRQDVATRCMISVRGERALRQNPGIVIKTDPAIVAEIVNGSLISPDEIETTDELPVQTDRRSKLIRWAKNRRWNRAVYRAVKLNEISTQDTARYDINTLFDELRDPERRERAMETVEVLWERVPIVRRGR